MTETLNGEYEVTLVHPIDEAGKWTRLTENAILRVPVPARMTPYVKLPDNQIKLDVTSRGVWRLTQKSSVRIGPGANYKVLGSYYGGTRVAVLGTSYVVTVTNTATGTSTTSILSAYPSGSHEIGTTRTVAYWYKVTVPNGVTGYIPSSCASNVYHSTEIETVVGEVAESKQLREQPLRIYRVVPELNEVTVYARHIFYDLLDNMVKEYKSEASDRGAEALKGIGAACLTSTDFSFHSDLTGKSDDFEVTHKNPVDAIMGDAGLIEKYGSELARDWYDVYLVNRVGSDTNIEIREGKNLTAVMYDVNTTDVVTRIIPTGETGNGKLLYLPETYVDSTHINDYPHPKWLQLTVSDAKVGSGCTQTQAYTKLREAAQAKFDKGCDMPSVTLTVDFVNLFDTEEYKDYGFLQNIFLGDSVRVISKRLGISVSMRMTQYTYDCLLKKYTLMTLGTVADTLATNTITARQLPTGIVNGSKLAINSVGTGALQDGAVKTANIDIAAIETAHIRDAAISTAKIADASITSGKIADAAITNTKIHCPYRAKMNYTKRGKPVLSLTRESEP